MADFEMNARRAYARGEHFNFDARVSKDNVQWHGAEAADLSSSGLELRSPVEYAEGDVLWFDLHIFGFLSEFKIKTEGVIRRAKGKTGDLFFYGVSFKGLSQDSKIRIDENVRNSLPVGHGGFQADD